MGAVHTGATGADAVHHPRMGGGAVQRAVRARRLTYHSFIHLNTRINPYFSTLSHILNTSDTLC